MRTALLALALSLFAACGSEADETGELSLSIEGRVSTAVDGDAISGALVQYSSDTLDEAEDRTNADGDYSLRVQSAELRGHLKVSKKGYDTALVPVFFDDTRITVDVALTRK